MQIKGADDKQPDIAALQGLLGRSDVDAGLRRRIELEIRAIHAGWKGERDAAYEIEFYFGRSENFATIHDLRIEVGGLAAQIDHLIVNRLAEIWVCESKHFAEGVSVNDHGEWQRYWHGKPEGIPSPVEQNRKHIFLLQRVFDDGLVPLPRRMGVLPMKPDLRGVVLVSNNARLGRPRRPLAELDQVIKVEKLRDRIERAIEETPARRLSRAIGKDALATFARQLAALHRPERRDWAARFGLSPTPPSTGERPGRPADTSVPIDGSSASPSRRGSGHRCAACGDPVSFAVVKFCWNNTTRFGGRVYCMPCQRSVMASGGPQ